MLLKNEFRVGFADIRLENLAVATSRVVERPSRTSLNVNVYNPCAKLTIFVTAEARREKRLPPALNAPEPHRAICVWEINT